MPASDINSVHPTSLGHIVGQNSVKEQVSVALEAAWADNRKYDSALLVGPPGCGKSMFASVIAKEMASNYYEVLGQTIQRPSDLNALLLEAKDKDVIHIDECHELKKEFQTKLYLSIDQRKIVIGGGGRPESIGIADFTLLLSSTDEYSLLQPLRDRMRMVLRFEFYDLESLATLIRHRCIALGWTIEPEIIPMIAARSRGTPRLGLRLLQSCHRVARSMGARTVTMDHFERVCQLEQIDSGGLGPMDRKYLSLLLDGAKRLNVLASVMSLPPRTLSAVVEPYLIRAGYVIKDDSGRRDLTALGREHAIGGEHEISA